MMEVKMIESNLNDTLLIQYKNIKSNYDICFKQLTDAITEAVLERRDFAYVSIEKLPSDIEKLFIEITGLKLEYRVNVFLYKVSLNMEIK